MIYNFHHAHGQINDFPALLTKMLPYLKTVNINGMKPEGPKILPLGQGDKELDMLKTLKESGYNGPIGILGHVETADVKVILEGNLKGLKSLLEVMGDKDALATY
jgi:sugar phosphate isomerase/epimerase